MFQRLLKDIIVILRNHLPISQRLQMLSGLARTALGSNKMLGWRIEHLGRPHFVLLCSEIFSRQSYRFASARPDPIIFDCGANIGMATLYFKWLYPKAQITAFEPDPTTFGVLERNIARNHLKSTVAHNLALGEVDGEINFYIPEPGGGMMSALPGRTGGEPIQVVCRKLSNFITGPVDLLKLDVEGMEGPVLEDLEAAGKLSLVHEAVIEVHHNVPQSRTLGQILEIMERAGFQYHVMDAYAPNPDYRTFQDILIHAVRAQ